MSKRTLFEIHDLSINCVVTEIWRGYALRVSISQEGLCERFAMKISVHHNNIKEVNTSRRMRKVLVLISLSPDVLRVRSSQIRGNMSSAIIFMRAIKCVLVWPDRGYRRVCCRPRVSRSTTLSATKIPALFHYITRLVQEKRSVFSRTDRQARSGQNELFLKNVRVAWKKVSSRVEKTGPTCPALSQP